MNEEHSQDKRAEFEREDIQPEDQFDYTKAKPNHFAQHAHGLGDYTREREELFKDVSIDDIVNSMKQVELEHRNLTMIIRNETVSDIDAITEVTIAAFQNHPISQQTEQFIVHALREANALTISLVAEVDGRVVGHIAFSPVTISDGSSGWYGIGPLSVVPAYQRQGIGQALMHAGLALVKSSGGQGCVLVGDPGYYERFGFKNMPGLVLEGVPPEVFLALPFGEHTPQGVVLFHPGFAATG